MDGETRPRRPNGQWSRLSEAFVGRHAELEIFRRLLEDLHIGVGAVVLVSGEPGIGKSALLRHFARLAERASVSVSHDRAALPACEQPLVAPAVASPPATVRLVDDLHLADREELDRLHAAIQECTRVPLIIVAAYRDAPPGRSDRLAGFLARVAHDLPVVRLPLQGLTLAEVGEYIAAVRGNDDARPEIAASIHDRTDGNPFLVRELLSVLVSMPDADMASALGDVPAGVRDLVISRLDQLSPSARSILECAAVAGFTIDLRLLSEAMHVGGDALFERLAEAETAGFIYVSTEPSTYRFVHQLTRDAVLDALGYAKRVALHRAVGLALERLHLATEDSDSALAHHFAEVARVDSDYLPRAVAYLWRAGCAAAERGRWEDGAEAFAAAAGFLGEGQLAESGANRVEALVAAGRCWEAAGEARKAWHTFMLAATDCRHAGNRRGFAEIVLTALRDIDVPRQRRVELADEALSYVREMDDALTAHLLAERAADDGTPDADESAAEALALARAIGLVDVQRRLAKRTYTHALGRGDLLAVDAQLRSELAVTRHDPNARARAEQLQRVAETSIRSGDFARATHAADQALSFASKHHVQPVAGRARLFLASIALVRGDIREFEGLARQLWDRPIERQLLVRRAELVGQLATAANLIPAPNAPGADHPRVSWDLAGTRARIALAAGNTQAAAGYFAQWCRQREESYHPLDKHDALTTAGEALIALADEDTLAAVLAESAACPSIRFSPLTATGLDRLRGAIALRLGDLDSARGWLDRAAEWAESYQLIVEEVLTRHIRAQLLAASGDWLGALHTARAAAVGAEKYGFEGIAECVNRWLESIAGGEQDTHKFKAVTLTNREAEILRLVAEGHTNRRIALMLSISPHTANRHLSNILVKLDAANRAEAVKRAIDCRML
jgi:DNA-binding CsgD family transcriptional regulator